MKRPPALVLVLLIAGLLVLAAPAAHGEEAAPPSPTQAPLRLEDLERMALERNPTLAQAISAVRAAEGRRLQAGLYPNPTVGYTGEEISAIDPARHSQHYLFVEQRIVTAGKLTLGRGVAAQEQAQAAAGQEAQRRLVLNNVRLLFYETLGAQRALELRRELERLAQEAVGTSEQLYNVGQADRPDVLEAEVEAQRAALEAVRAANDLERSWQVLAAEVGEPDLRRAPLAGDLEEGIPRLDQEAMLATLLRESPEVAMAKARLERAEEALRLARALPVPDVLLSGGFGYNIEADEPEAFLKVGLPLPLFDRNQGNIAAARAELDGARQEVRRLELALRARLAAAFTTYQSALQAVGRYRTGILPRAREAYELYLSRYRQMAAAYPQVLIAQRSQAQAAVAYVGSLVELWRSVVAIQGLLLTGGPDVAAGAM